MRLLIQLFWNFLLIGFFGIGSAYISIPLLYDRIVVANKWLQPGQFSDLLSLCRMLPGPTEINMAAFVGYGSVSQQLGAGMGLLGVLTAMAAMATVSFVLMFPTLRLFADKEANAMAQSIMESLRPVTAGMMMAFLILLSTWRTLAIPTCSNGISYQASFCLLPPCWVCITSVLTPFSFCCFAVWPAYSFIKAGKSAPARLA